MSNRNSENDYLANILILQKERGFAKSVDLANRLGVSKPTVCEAVKKLCKKGLICIGEKRHILLTDEGEMIAERIHDKKIYIKEVLTAMGVSEAVATKDAGKIEHVISNETYDCLCSFFECNK